MKYEILEAKFRVSIVFYETLSHVLNYPDEIIKIINKSKIQGDLIDIMTSGNTKVCIAEWISIRYEILRGSSPLDLQWYTNMMAHCNNFYCELYDYILLKPNLEDMKYVRTCVLLEQSMYKRLRSIKRMFNIIPTTIAVAIEK